MNISIKLTNNPKQFPDVSALGFGKYFSDHLFFMDYSKDSGWHNAQVVPYSDFHIYPSNLTFHYGQTVFEGLKAFRQPNGEVKIYRLEDHINRLSKSAERLCMPKFDKEFAMQACKLLVDIDSKWVPSVEGRSLYLRPFIMASDEALGVRPSNNYRFIVITSPVGSYYSKGLAPTKILVEENYSRVAHGGLGEAKTGANYAASLLAAEKAKAQGFDQVLWLDCVEHKFIEEVGTMNIFFVIDNTLVTPPLDGTILHGVTRKTVIEIANEWGVDVQERPISIDEVCAAFESGSLKEVFGSGTAAVISQVGELSYKGKSMVINEPASSLRVQLFEVISKIQHGLIPDTKNRLCDLGNNDFNREFIRKDFIDTEAAQENIITVNKAVA